jgi:tRNA(fMet)-specific endonuclease VapC
MSLLMLDTDISSYIIKRRPESLVNRFETHAEQLCVSVITAAELRFGAEKAKRPQLTELVEAFLDRLAILDWTNSATHHYARLRWALEQAGTPIGNMDLLIASHAISERSMLVTNNLKHFSRVPGLNLEEWKVSP